MGKFMKSKYRGKITISIQNRNKNARAPIIYAHCTLIKVTQQCTSASKMYIVCHYKILTQIKYLKCTLLNLLHAYVCHCGNLTQRIRSQMHGQSPVKAKLGSAPTPVQNEIRKYSLTHAKKAQ
jgi:hypothetical protein